MLELEGVGVRIGGRDILDSIDLALEPGSLTVLVGPNGAGKSTLLKAMTGELRPDRGRILFAGQPLSAMTPAALAARRAVLPQASVLAFPFTVTEVVALGQRHRPGATAQDRHREAAVSLDRVGLAGFGGRMFQELSGGEQQRTHLARVLCQIGEPVTDGQPKALFLDEPTSSLDIRHQVAVLAIARAFSDAGGMVFAILHDLNLAAGFADRYLVMQDGRIALDGPAHEVLADRRLGHVFGIGLEVQRRKTDGTPFVMPSLATGSPSPLRGPQAAADDFGPRDGAEPRTEPFKARANLHAP